MKTIRIITPALLSIVLASVGCGGSEAAEESTPDTQEATSAVAAQPGGYGYEMMDDQASTPAAPATAPAADWPAARLAPELIQATVRASFTDMRICYEDALQIDPALAGKVTVNFNVNEDGSVFNAADGGSTIADAAMVQCVIDVIAGSTFPTSSGGVVEVMYPIMFSPGEE